MLMREVFSFHGGEIKGIFQGTSSHSSPIKGGHPLLIEQHLKEQRATPRGPFQGLRPQIAS
jgi:hypothetical protein